MSQLVFSAGGLSVSCSAGCTVKKTGCSFGEIFTLADKALYSAKNSGKGKLYITEKA